MSDANLDIIFIRRCLLSNAVQRKGENMLHKVSGYQENVMIIVQNLFVLEDHNIFPDQAIFSLIVGQHKMESPELASRDRGHLF